MSHATTYFSCVQARKGFNFYRSNKITACCFNIDPELEICDITDRNAIQKIIDFKQSLLDKHRLGIAPDICKKCSQFHLKDWSIFNPDKFLTLTLNHFKKCNLKCTHCGYRKNDQNEFDTDHDLVLYMLKKCMDASMFDKNAHLEIGGGEPSIAPGIDNILRYAMSKRLPSLINSNAAVFKPLYADGVNAGLITLLLTPDAGSRETYAKIKGNDCFDLAWDNIASYMRAASGLPIVKFIIEKGNRDDVAAMIETSAARSVKNLALSLDLTIPKSEHEDYRRPVELFKMLAAERGLEIVAYFLPKSLTRSA